MARRLCRHKISDIWAKRDRSRLLQVQLRAGDLDDRYYEVWLIDEAVRDMVSGGVARSGTVTFELPVGLDPLRGLGRPRCARHLSAALA